MRHKYSFYLTFLLLVFLLGMSAMCIWSIEVKASNNAGTFIRHCVYALLALLCYTGVFIYGHKRAKKWVPAVYAMMLVCLVLVLLIGPKIAGSQRWIFIGPISFQPSEVAKLVLILSLANHLASLRRFDWIQGFLLCLHVTVPVFLIYKEPDLGTSLVVLGIFLSLLVVSTVSDFVLLFIVTPLFSLLLYYFLPWLWLLYVFIGILGVLAYYVFQRWQRQIRPWLLGQYLTVLLLNLSISGILQYFWQQMKPYQQERILSFISASSNQLDSGYQVMQSQIAIGAGGLWGQGLFSGSQTQLKWVPEQRTDFIFSALGEEWGFIGASLVICVFLILIFRMFKAGLQSKEAFGRYVCTGVGTLFLIHVLINVGMNIGVMPVTGVPLPLFSYGGTALLIQAASLGLIESIVSERAEEEWV